MSELVTDEEFSIVQQQAILALDEMYDRHKNNFLGYLEDNLESYQYLEACCRFYEKNYYVSRLPTIVEFMEYISNRRGVNE